MTNEIKEIIDILSFNRDTILNGTCRVEDFISREQIINLLDYITNLQEEKQRLLESADCLSKGYSDLEKRIDKAKEYILHEWFKREQIGIAPLQFSYEELQNVLDILRGEE